MGVDTFDDWHGVLARARVGVTPAELHGSLSGFLCAGWGGNAGELLASLALDSDGGSSARSDLDALLERAAVRIAGRLRAAQPVEVLLPAQPLAARANAAVDWTRGYLGGLGLTGVLDAAGKRTEVRATLAELAQIAAAHLECGPGDDPALTEVLACIRADVACLYAAFAPEAGA